MLRDRVLRTWLAAAAVVSAFPAVAAGQVAPSLPQPRATLTLRAEPSFGMLVLPTGLTSLGGGNASVRFAHLVEAELGVDYRFLIPCKKGPSLTMRAGVSPSVLEPDTGHTRWNVRIPLLLSYSYARLDPGSCEVSHDERQHELTGASGLDATFWFSRHVAFNVRLLGFVGALRRAEGGPYPVTETHVVFGLNVGLGVALPL